MQRTVLIAVAGLMMSVASAWANVQTNGIQANGVLWSNGIQANGIQANGIQANGIQANGIQANGIQANGIQANGIQMSFASVAGTQIEGSFIGSGSSSLPYTCSHREDAAGAALPSSCSPCAQIVTAADSYCTNTYWDGLCVQQAQASCRATLTTGSTLTANMTDGSTRTMRVGTRYQGGWTWDGVKWVDNRDVWTQNVTWVLPHTPSTVGEKLAAGQFGNACVKQVCAADSYCCNNYWDQQCVNEASSMCTSTKSLLVAKGSTTGDSVCGYDPNTNAARQAMFVGGAWNMQSGYQGAGGKLAAAPGQITVACRGVGAVAKCVDMGFKPWKSSQMDTYHQSCVRMVRADYCGDGTPWTTDGTTINVTDYLNTQADTEVWHLEATWSPKGARHLWYARLWQNPVVNASTYIASHPYCNYNATTGWGFTPVDPYVSGWEQAHVLNNTTQLMRTETNQTCDGDNCPP